MFTLKYRKKKNPAFSEWLFSRHTSALKDKNRLSSLSGQRKSLEQGSHGVCLFAIRDIFPIPCSLEATQDCEATGRLLRRAGKCVVCVLAHGHGGRASLAKEGVVELFLEFLSFGVRTLSFNGIFIEHLLHSRHYSRPCGCICEQNRKKKEHLLM